MGGFGVYRRNAPKAVFQHLPPTTLGQLLGKVAVAPHESKV